MELGRRAFLGVAAMAPVAAPLAAQEASAAYANAGGAVGMVYPSGPSPMGEVARHLGEKAGIGPWIKAGLEEHVWKRMREEQKRLHSELERLQYRPDLNIEAMKSWSPSFRVAMADARKEEIRAMLQHLTAKLYPDRNLLDPA